MHACDSREVVVRWTQQRQRPSSERSREASDNRGAVVVRVLSRGRIIKDMAKGNALFKKCIL